VAVVALAAGAAVVPSEDIKGPSGSETLESKAGKVERLCRFFYGKIMGAGVGVWAPGTGAVFGFRFSVFVKKYFWSNPYKSLPFLKGD